MILVTSYQDPDLDGTACSVGEAEVLVHQGGNEWLRDALSKATGVSWIGNRATTSGIIMRKELVPLLREILD